MNTSRRIWVLLGLLLMLSMAAGAQVCLAAIAWSG
jgi:hypothetical protein